MDRCNTPTPVGILALDGGNNNIAPVPVNLGGTVPTVSVAVKMEQFSFVFVATDDMRIRGVSVLQSTSVYTNALLVSTV